MLDFVDSTTLSAISQFVVTFAFEMLNAVEIMFLALFLVAVMIMFNALVLYIKDIYKDLFMSNAHVLYVKDIDKDLVMFNPHELHIADIHEERFLFLATWTADQLARRNNNNLIALHHKKVEPEQTKPRETSFTGDFEIAKDVHEIAVKLQVTPDQVLHGINSGELVNDHHIKEVPFEVIVKDITKCHIKAFQNRELDVKYLSDKYLQARDFGEGNFDSNSYWDSDDISRISDVTDFINNDLKHEVRKHR